jgi:trehalose 6-phosphate synthase/phosphatase
MISGIQSLSTTHEQLIVGWTGDIEVVPSSCPTPETNPSGEKEKVRISADKISESDRSALEHTLGEYRGNEASGESKEGIKNLGTTYVPVWMEDSIAHGHYDGYCKQSECRVKISTLCFLDPAISQSPSRAMSFSCLFP